MTELQTLVFLLILALSSALCPVILNLLSYIGFFVILPLVLLERMIASLYALIFDVD